VGDDELGRFGTPRTISLVLGNSAVLREGFKNGGGSQIINDKTLSSSPTVGGWTRVVLHLRRESAQTKIEITFDGVPALAPVNLDASWGPGTIEFNFGLSTDGGGAWEVRHDNVTFDNP
jgi:hypothetical protein